MLSEYLVREHILGAEGKRTHSVREHILREYLVREHILGAGRQRKGPTAVFLSEYLVISVYTYTYTYMHEDQYDKKVW